MYNQLILPVRQLGSVQVFSLGRGLSCRLVNSELGANSHPRVTNVGYIRQ